MRAVKLDKHTGFADENDMYSYFVSAKSGDNVASAFHRIAADWAGVVLTKPEMEIAAVRSPLPSPQQRWPELSTVGCVVRRSRWWRALSTTRGTPSCRRGTGQTRGRAAAPCNDGGAGFGAHRYALCAGRWGLLFKKVDHETFDVSVFTLPAVCNKGTANRFHGGGARRALDLLLGR